MHTKSVRLVTNTRTSETMLDILIDGSKTGHMRYTGCVDKTASGLVSISSSTPTGGSFASVSYKGLAYDEWFTNGKLEK
eukprot:1573063-Prymnesium_polylepis.1